MTKLVELDDLDEPFYTIARDKTIKAYRDDSASSYTIYDAGDMFITKFEYKAYDGDDGRYAFHVMVINKRTKNVVFEESEDWPSFEEDDAIRYYKKAKGLIKAGDRQGLTNI